MHLNEWINEFCELLENNNTEIAYKLFEDHRAHLNYITDETILDKLRLLDLSLLNSEQRKEYLLYLVVTAGMINKRDNKQEKEIDMLLKEFESILESEIIQNLNLEKANIATINKYYYKANSIYKKLIDDNKIEPGIKAYAYQGLSLIVGTHPNWPPRAFSFGHPAHQHLATSRTRYLTTFSSLCVYKLELSERIFFNTIMHLI